MSRSPRARRLATVLFLDIVESTRIAADIGDQRWRELLERFRRIVRAELKRFGGREVDTSGDGFLTTFEEPAQAIRAAVAIASAVHDLGIEVRSGIHTGEVEFAGTNVAGMAVHIGARVMSLAHGAEVLVTSTVKDLVAGSRIRFEDFSVHELKGIPGAWQLFTVTEVDGSPVAGPLAAEHAVERIQAAGLAPAHRRGRRAIVLAAAAAVLVSGAVALVFLWGDRTTRPAGDGTKGPARDRSNARITLLKVDPESGQIIRKVQDQYFSEHLPGTLRTANGVLWQYVPGEFIQRDLATGAVRHKIAVGSQTANDITFAFGSFWVGLQSGQVLRLDAISGRQQGRLDAGSSVFSISADTQAVWFLNETGELGRINPIANRIRTYRIDAHGVVVPLAGSVWICDCDNHRILQFDPQQERVTRTVVTPEHGVLIGVDALDGKTMWMLDVEGSTVTPLDPKTGRPGQPLGFGGHLHYAEIGFGSIWIAAGADLYQVDLETKEKKKIDMPPGVSAGGIAIDQQTGSLWVQNCGCPIDE